MSEQKKTKAGRGTLCWYCKNAVPDTSVGRGCSWSKHFKPVEGWDATPTLIQSRPKSEKAVSYMVLDCPEFSNG